MLQRLYNKTMSSMTSSDNTNQQGYTNRKWSKEDLGNLWHSLFDYDRLSGCRQDDTELMSAAILLKKTFQLFKDVRQRCDDAEEACAKQEECQNCVKLLQENAKQRERLKEMEVRHKAVGRLLNLIGSADDGSQLLRNSQQMEALTQAFLGDPPRKLRGVKRRHILLDDGGVPETLPQERRHTAAQNIVIPETLDFNHTCTTPDPCPEGEICDVMEISTVTPRQTLDKRRESPEAERQTQNIADFDVTQTPDVLYTKLTPDKQCSPEECPPKSPVIGSSSLSKKSRSFRRATKLTQSTQESSFSCVPEVKKLNESGISPLSRLAMIVGTPKIIETPPESRPSHVSPNCTGGTFDVSLDESPSVISNPGFGREILKMPKNKKVKENIMDRSNKSQLQDSVACVQDMKGSQASGTGKVKLGERKQADYWQLKPTTSVQSLSITGKESKLKQTKLSLGVFSKRTDLCSLTGFNGGIRLSQSPLTNASDKASTRASDEKIAADLLEGLNDSDFLSPSPKVAGSIPKRIYGSQAAKTMRKCLVMDEVNDQTLYEPPQTNEKTYSNDNIPNAIEKLSARTNLLRDGAIQPRDKANSSDLPLGKPCKSLLLQPNGGETQENVEDLLKQMGFPETPRTKELVQNFDKIPSKNKNEPKFKYKGDVVRKKEDRMKLEGWDCYECQDFFDGRGDDAAKQKALMNQCSRHRDKNERTKSPEGYWDAGFPSTQECRERNLNITQSGKPLRSRRKKD